MDAPQPALRIDQIVPPYLLTCDLAAFPVRADAAAAGHWAGAHPPALLGQSLLWLLAARYYAAASGPDRAPVAFGEGPDLYREVSWMLLTGVFPGFRAQFPRLWVDASDPLPLELGRAYGFPKEPGSIDWRRSERGLEVTVTDARGVALALGCHELRSLPPGLVTFFAALRADFPSTGHQAQLRLLDARRAALLRVRRWEAPRGAQWGLAGGPSLGVWLEGARLWVGPPEGGGGPE